MHRNMRNLWIIAAVLLGAVIGSHSTVLAQPNRAPFFAILLGANEVSNSGQANAGDLDGSGAVTLIIEGSDQVCFGIVVNQIGRPTNLHIHEGIAGVNGGVVVPLAPFPDTGNPGSSSGCVTADPDVLRRIRLTPSAFYVNIHNDRFPGGALRGQLF